ncbi:hypothetical protein E2562_034913 [Oryza meyeriana var. granulata]|uniref:Uncharacterized protein n=1 Tax=Oryza meyeriana var. granulata TaxID=110450 RepID=A0A6G1F1K7_9ORYZ|nr:hypothetical protein E2562_034913 [Oryza meyeriana var. granulata]
MPVAYNTIILHLGVLVTVAWRITYLLPCAMLVATGLAVLAFPYDLPRGFACGGARRLPASLPAAGLNAFPLAPSPVSRCLPARCRRAPQAPPSTAAEYLELPHPWPPSTSSSSVSCQI